MKPSTFAVLFVLAAYGTASAVAQPYATVADAIKALPQTTSLAANLSTSSLATLISDPTLVATVFAPNNAAMDQLSAAINGVGSSSDNSALIDDALNYHVVPGAALTSDQLTNGMVLKTKQGESLTVIIKDGGLIFINGSQTYPAQVVSPNILAGKAVVHIINNVLLPSSSADLVNALEDGAPAPAIQPVTAAVTVTPAATPADASAPMTANMTMPSGMNMSGMNMSGMNMASPMAAADVSTPTATPAPTATSGAAGVSVAAAVVALPALLALVL